MQVISKLDLGVKDMIPEISKLWKSLDEPQQNDWRQKAIVLKKSMEQEPSSPSPQKSKVEKSSTPSISLQKYFEDANVSHESKKKDKKKSKNKLERHREVESSSVTESEGEVEKPRKKSKQSS